MQWAPVLMVIEQNRPHGIKVTTMMNGGGSEGKNKNFFRV